MPLGNEGKPCNCIYLTNNKLPMTIKDFIGSGETCDNNAIKHVLEASTKNIADLTCDSKQRLE